MSMDTCQLCGRIVDTDDDPDFYVELGNMRRLHKTIGLCDLCRDKCHETIERNEAMRP
jgi:hypothetical protein